MRVLGLDVGSRRIGVAVSDESQLIAQPIEYIDVKTTNPVKRISLLIQKYHISKVVIGLPLSMSGGDRGLSSRRARALGKVVEEKLKVEVAYVDERFTTSHAQNVLLEGNVSRKKRKEVIDQIAASLILQGYLDGRQK